MHYGGIAVICTQFYNPVTQPADILLKELAMLTELCLDVVDEGMGEDLCALDNHLIGVLVPVVAGLCEYGEQLIRNVAVVFVCYNFAHETMSCLSDGVKYGLSYAVTDGGVQSPAVYRNRFDEL